MLLCLLVLGDVLFLLKVFQKTLQGDDVTIVDIVPDTKKFIAKIDKLHQRPVLGGWEDKFLQSYEEENGTFLEEFCGKKNDARLVEISFFFRNESVLRDKGRGITVIA
jgi:hypothetical protein